LQTEYDDIIYNPANVIYGAIHRNGLGKGCVSPIYKIFYTNQNAVFMECIIRHPRFINEISRSMEGTVKKLRTLKPTAFLNMTAYVAPTLEEQKKIGDFFQQLDRLIEIELMEIEKIKNIKSTCLEKMFA
jgi:type I restriction enzyme S subunit